MAPVTRAVRRGLGGTIRFAQPGQAIDRVRVVFTSQWVLALLLAASIVFNLAQCFGRTGELMEPTTPNGRERGAGGGAASDSGLGMGDAFFDDAANTMNLRGVVEPAGDWPLLVSPATEGRLARWLVGVNEDVVEGQALVVLANAALVAEADAMRIDAEVAEARLERLAPARRQAELDVIDADLDRIDQRRRLLDEQVQAAAGVRQSISDLEYMQLQGARDDANVQYEIVSRQRETLVNAIDADHTEAQSKAAALAIRAAALRRQVDALTVKAPREGRVLSIEARVGEWVEPGTGALCVLYDPDRLRVRVPLRESDSNHVYPGQDVQIFLDSGNDPFSGSLASVLPQAHEASNTLTLLVTVYDATERIKPGIEVLVAFDQTPAPAESEPVRDDE